MRLTAATDWELLELLDQPPMIGSTEESKPALLSSNQGGSARNMMATSLLSMLSSQLNGSRAAVAAITDPFIKGLPQPLAPPASSPLSESDRALRAITDIILPALRGIALPSGAPRCLSRV